MSPFRIQYNNVTWYDPFIWAELNFFQSAEPPIVFYDSRNRSGVVVTVFQREMDAHSGEESCKPGSQSQGVKAIGIRSRGLSGLSFSKHTELTPEKARRNPHLWLWEQEIYSFQ